jgi:hypothetical protein
MDPVNPKILYATTGGDFDTRVSCGILKTTDGGVSWTNLPAPYATGGFEYARLLIDRASAGSATSTTLYAAAPAGLFRSVNSGQSWSAVLTGTGLTDIVADPLVSTTLYAAAGGWEVRPVSWTALTAFCCGHPWGVKLAKKLKGA